MRALTFGDIDLTEKSTILSKLTSAGIAIEIVQECRNQDMPVDKLNQSLKESLNKGINDIQFVLSDVDGVLTRIINKKPISAYQLMHVQELLKIFKFVWANAAAEILDKEKFTKSDINRLERATEGLKDTRSFLNKIKIGEKQTFEKIDFKRLTESITSLQKTMLKDWLEEVNTLEQSGEESYDLLAVN